MICHIYINNINIPTPPVEQSCELYVCYVCKIRVSLKYNRYQYDYFGVHKYYFKRANLLAVPLKEINFSSLHN